ncbi:helix-turn-helix transcriptional regulator [Rapidithrix thailandica]|uniref:Helix-turn-helix transcriptional regulator n=1 Tax=Rapidithrix thailandica TaxID=413964 RepID=A0AAW9SFH5_9BACT
METIKIYKQVNREHPSKSFGISKMEETYHKLHGQPDHPHRHDFYTILLVENAKGTHNIDFRAYDLTGQQVFFISPGQVHQVIENEPSQGYSMVFSTDFLVENNIPFSFIEDLNLFHDYNYNPPLTGTSAQFSKLLHYCSDIESYFHSDNKFKERAIGALLELFLITCNNLCTLPMQDAQQWESGKVLLKKFKSLVEQHHSYWHSASQYADALNITADHLNRTIKGLTGKTIKEYLQSRIMVSAKRLLYFSDATTKEIAYQLGFSEPANFSAFFKKNAGVSPTQFRKNP